MNCKISIVAMFLLFFLLQVFPSGEAEGAASATHGKYLAGKGIIVPPDEIHIDSYIAQIDYNYRTPDIDEFAVYTYTGNRQLSNKGQKELIQIGLKARKLAFEDLPPMNLVFVIDKSGSMSYDEKIDWVKESFDIFIEKVRDIDFVSVVTFSSNSEVIFPSTKMDSQTKRKKFKDAVNKIITGGGTNLIAGLEDGYSQALSNLREGYNNRVLFLTDGVGENSGIIEMAKTYKDLGINISTIGVGSNFDVNLMVDLAKAGGGSSRFISDREEMRETFGDELDRMIVPAASNLNIRLEFPEYITRGETWGYRNEKLSNGFSYKLPTIHNGDYETIIAEIDVLPSELIGMNKIAEVFIEYDSIDGKHIVKDPISISAEFVETLLPVFGVSDYTVLQSSTMLYIARKMKEVGSYYYNTQQLINELNKARNDLFNQENENVELELDKRQAAYESTSSSEIVSLEEQINDSFSKALDISREAKSFVLNNKIKLDNIGFDDEIGIFDKYIEIIGKDLKIPRKQVVELKEAKEMTPQYEIRNLDSYLDCMFREILLSLPDQDSITIAVAPFIQSKENISAFTAYIDQSALVLFSQGSNISVVDRSRMDDILSEQKMTLSGLVDTENALEIGNLLSAECLITGNVIPMSKTVVVFSRALNIETGEVIAVAQAVIPTTQSLSEMVRVQ